MSNASDASPSNPEYLPVPLGYDPRVADQFSVLPEAVIAAKRVPTQPHVRVKPVVISYYKSGTRSSAFEGLEYNLREIAKAADTESYITRSVNKHLTLMLRNGSYLDSRNPRTLQYAYFRLSEMARNTNLPFNLLLRSLVQNLILFSNAFLVVVRDSTRSSGKRTRMFGREIAPIAGVFSADPTCMTVKRNEHGVPIKWRQYAQGQEKFFPKENVIHAYYSKKDGFIAGTPWILPVLDDIRSWRRIEELVEMLASKHAFPLFHYQVGTDALPARDWDSGDSEVARVKSAVERMPTDGCLVTPERHKITAIGSEGKALDLKPYLAYWESRVMAGLNLSGIDLGKGECHDEQTQTLTEKGWRYWYQIDHKKERIATFNPDTNAAEYHLAEHAFIEDYEGDMIHFKSEKHVDIMVTPNHDMWIAKSKHSGRPILWRKAKAWELLQREAAEFYVRDAVTDAESHGWSTNFPVVVPWVAYSKYQAFRNNEGADTHVSAVDMASLVGWYVTDGNAARIVNKHRITISQRKQAGVTLLHDLWGRLPFKGNIRKHTKREDFVFEINHKGLYKWLIENCGSGMYTKRLPRDLILGSPDVLRAVLDAIVAGDGSVDTRTGRIHCTVYTVSKQLRDDVQEIAFRLGYSAKCAERQQHESSWGEGTIFSVLISMRRDTRGVRSSDVSTVPYSGKVYCYTVPNHLFITRRNGRIAIQGNSSSKATAAQMSKGLADFCTDLQSIVSQFLDFYFFDALLEEGGYPLNEFNRVHLKFPIIDTDEQLKLEKHAEFLFSNNDITEDEMRRRMGAQPITPDMRKGLHMELYEKPLAIIAASDEPFTEHAKAALKSTAASKATGAAKVGKTLQQSMAKKKNLSENMNRPTNQGGKLVAKTTPVRDGLVRMWSRLPAADSTETAMEEFSTAFEDRMLPILVSRMEEGMSDFGSKDSFVGENMRKYFTNHCLKVELNKLTDGHKDISGIRLASRLGSLRPLLESLLDGVEAAAYSFGFRYAALLTGHNQVWWVPAKDACDECKRLSKGPRPVHKLTYEELVPPHAACMDGMRVEDAPDDMTEDDMALRDVVLPLLDAEELDLTKEEYMPLLEQVAETEDKKLSTAQREKLPAGVFCGPNRTFPCNDMAHVKIARVFIKKYKGSGDKAKVNTCIEAKAKELGTG